MIPLDPTLTLYPIQAPAPVEPFVVEFASLKRPGTSVATSYGTLREAVEVCRTNRDQRKQPTLTYDAPDGWTALPFCANPHDARPRLQWSMRFKPVDVYKSLFCRRAEAAGVRYLSHRKGYVASDTAFRKFCISVEEIL